MQESPGGGGTAAEHDPYHALTAMETSSIPCLWAGAQPIGEGKGLCSCTWHSLDHVWIPRAPQYVMDVSELQQVQGGPQGGCAGAQETVPTLLLEVCSLAGYSPEHPALRFMREVGPETPLRSLPT